VEIIRILGNKEEYMDLLLLGDEQENDKKASEKPKITPTRTRLNTSRFIDENFSLRFM
jgi:hypothetical protein